MNRHIISQIEPLTESLHVAAPDILVIELRIVLLIFMSGFQNNGKPDYITAAYLLSQNVIRLPPSLSLFGFLI
jgi:hypothetical protein